MKISPQRIQVTCSRCGNLYPAGVWQVVDVQLDPDLKRQLLRGQINVNTCPNCGHRVAVGTPLAYHDSDKELFLILVPTDLSLSSEKQEKAIGDLTNMLMSSLPAEKRKGYLFQPKTFFSMRSLQEEILRADGVTPEMIENQMEKSQLIQELLAQVEDEASLKTLAEERKGQLDYEFFLLLSASIEEARQEGNVALAEQLAALRGELLELTGAPGVPLPEDLEGEMTVEELIQEMVGGHSRETFQWRYMISRVVLLLFMDGIDPLEDLGKLWVVE